MLGFVVVKPERCLCRLMIEIWILCIPLLEPVIPPLWRIWEELLPKFLSLVVCTQPARRKVTNCWKIIQTFLHRHDVESFFFFFFPPEQNQFDVWMHKNRVMVFFAQNTMQQKDTFFLVLAYIQTDLLFQLQLVDHLHCKKKKKKRKKKKLWICATDQNLNYMQLRLSKSSSSEERIVSHIVQ
jgi:hypothetical protein